MLDYCKMTGREIPAKDDYSVDAEGVLVIRRGKLDVDKLISVALSL